MRRWKSAVFVSIAVACAGIACSLQDGGTYIGEGTDGSSGGDGTIGDDGSSGGDGTTGSDGSSGNDGESEASLDSGNDGASGPTFLCGTTPVVSCQTDCPGAANDCPITGTCVADCTASCFNGVTFDTRYCNACFSDGGAALSVCVPADPAAVASCLAGYNRCPCPTNAGDCPGAYDTCESNQCFACGEPDAGNGGHNCKGGTGAKNCDTGGSALDHLRCH